MTRKDYVKFADALKGCRAVWAQNNSASEAIDDMEREVCMILADDNPNFDRARFIEASH